MKNIDVTHLPRRLRIDHRPGLYYVLARNGERTFVLLGPFKRYGQAARFRGACEALACKADPWACFYTYGVARLPLPPGKEPVRFHQGTMNTYFGITSYTPGRKAPWRTNKTPHRAYPT